MATTDFRTPRSRAKALGASGGTHHWASINISSVMLVPLALLFVVPFAQSLGSDHAAVIETYRDPFNAIIAVLFIGVAFHHLWQGLQVVIEDYVHQKGLLVAALLANTLVCGFAGVAGVFAVLKIAFTG